MKAVFGLSSSFISTCQYPDARSRDINHCAFPIESKISSILGKAAPIYTSG